MIPVLGVPVLNRPDLLHRMLDSIDYPVGDLVIVDNGDCFPAWEPVEWVERSHVIKMPTNLGVAASWNLIVKSTPFAPWWLIVNSDAWFPAGSLEMFAQQARSDALVLSNGNPPWAAWAWGDEVVARVGLMDEGYFPAYHEDTDYTRRVRAAGVPIVPTTIHVHHDNSSTIRSGYESHNLRTFPANEAYFRAKVEAEDFSEGHWSLTRRRDLSWD